MAQGRQGRPRQKSEYGQRLEEKQNLKGEYGLREKQFSNYFKKGTDSASIFGLLESRLDSVLYRSGFAPTRGAARQMASHGHAIVNGRRVTIPSYQLRTGDKVNVREGSYGSGLFADYDMRMKKFEPPSWLVLDKKAREITIKGIPDMREQAQPFNFQTVIEFYSR
ncbi:MAG: hypothetical protein A2932_00660 [Candidatus Spechtbacteria bacterium RIFCSPLOWO2_01_FULL_46_10]|uniref:Small ribosomal subunit protein uS4 n=1 Tax=Candidatus Spechtbacteria bacterium RIFCSPLOWO2_01_FULL_46_10 TaxID=1802163 RepID=A0A1G2HHK6_9BACT|nr:MAG: hypothetical protein A2932_00660 [Candidatus Spechtbacteria bacterium RIFCSPLOWO2_01_FULL_46_10]